ncbi:M10 family metallopeptidase C-terminal domain-containing protein [Hansschlegelia sp. KR7-227]|uniref:M10 family metallopeptidase C-terminal domain-containing protein n=1 Tax=Hansschlegelia sp. KR7-227 TaxID=3400914 RepID=UPI003C0D0F5B
MTRRTRGFAMCFFCAPGRGLSVDLYDDQAPVDGGAEPPAVAPALAIPTDLSATKAEAPASLAPASPDSGEDPGAGADAPRIDAAVFYERWAAALQNNPAAAGPATPTMAEEVTFLNGLDADGTVSTNSSFWSFNDTTARKWGDPTAGTGATITYVFDAGANWNATEKATFLKGFAMWEAVADVTFVEVAAGQAANANFKIVRGTDGGAFQNGPVSPGSGATIGSYTGQAVISIDPTALSFELSGSLDVHGGYGMATVIHELGHMLGLGHGGLYNGTVDQATQQFSAFDERLYTTMSYIGWTKTGAKFEESYPVTGTDWGPTPDPDWQQRESPHTVQMLDIIAIQQLYGASEDTPFDGGQTYGFNCTIDGLLKQFFDFTLNKNPVVTIYSQGVDNTIDCSGFSQNATLDLNGGFFSSVGGHANNLAVAIGTVVETGRTGSGDDNLFASGADSVLDSGAGQDNLIGKGGDDSLMGGAGNDVMIGGAGNDRLFGGFARGATGGGPGLEFGSGQVSFTKNPGNVDFQNAVDVSKQFIQTADPNIEAATVFPHVTIDGVGGGAGNDFYKFTIQGSLAGVTIDVDTLGLQNSFDTIIALYDANGFLITSADDSFTIDSGSPTRQRNDGFLDTTDSFLSYVLDRPGTYYIGVFAYNPQTDSPASFLGEGLRYRMHLSISNEAVAPARRDGDILVGGDGIDTADYSAAVAGVTIDLGLATAQTAAGGAQNDLLSGIEKLVGSAFADMLTTAAAGGALDGGAGADRLTGRGGADTLIGGAGDTLTGAAGDDRYVVQSKGATIVEAAGGGTDTVQSSITMTLAANLETLVLTGGGAINGTGNAAANRLTGNARANTLNGAGGADTLSGGDGNDTYIVDSRGDKTVEAAGRGVDVVRTALSWTLAANVENLVLVGSKAVDGTGNGLANTLTGNARANTLNGMAGADVLRGGGGDDVYVVDNARDRVIEAARGGEDTTRAAVTHALADQVENLILVGARTINGTGNALANEIAGNAKANVLNGLGGVDTMAGGAGNDVYIVDESRDQVVEAARAGVDTVRASKAYTLSDNVENLTLTGDGRINGVGNALENRITGNGAANRLDGRGGADVMEGRGGGDVYVVNHRQDKVVEAVGGGTDRIESSVTFTLSANVENLTLTGGAKINGFGNAGKNAIVGNTAGNILDGGLGSDRLTGGRGADIFVFDDALGRTNVDLITDFSVKDDTIRIDNSIFFGLKTGALAGGAFAFGLEASDRLDRILYDKGSGALLFDRDGSAERFDAIRFATLDDGLALTRLDFFVV